MQYERTEVVRTSHGPVRGFVDDGMRKYLGIPYAAPPTGGLRWRPPHFPPPWDTPLDTISFGATCAQSSVCFPGFAKESSTEDCLYLNVFTPISSVLEKTEELPVMVWIHGGGCASGASNDYNPSALVKDGHTVFVSMNYRVAPFGFFSHPAINAEGHSAGNYGFMDQQLALRWVQQNIKGFGGNPSNVTLFGESAGGLCALAHVAAPTSRGLFHKAIIQSGGAPPSLPCPSIEDLEPMGVNLASAAGCTEQTTDNLRSITTADIMAANAVEDGAFGTARYPFTLMEDGEIVPKNVREVFASGSFTKVPMIVGVVRDEHAWFQAMMELRTGNIVSAEAYPDTVATTLAFLAKNHLGGLKVPPHAIPEIIKMYPVQAFESPSRAVVAVMSDSVLISIAGRRTMRVLADHVPGVYGYEFDVQDTACPYPEVSFPYGSAHTLELPYIFPGFRGGSGKPTLLTEPQQHLARRMVHYWTTFAHHGTPNGTDENVITRTENSCQPNWKSYSAETDNVMLFQTAAPIGTINFWGRRHNSDYWDSFYEWDHVNEATRIG